MKTKLLLGPLFAAMSLLLAGGAYAAGPGQTRYRVINLGNPEGGTASQATTDTQFGWIAGWSTQADGTMLAELWRYGSAVELGTLGGPQSSVAWPNRNDQGVIVGISDMDEVQPHGETWSCELAVYLTPADDHVCRGFVWRDGRMSALPTLGGDNGFATGVNNRGEIVGWAENATHDPTCDQFNNTGQVLQFEAVMWVQDRDDDRGRTDSGYRAIELPPYPGDLDGAATAINQWGEAVGISGICDGAIGGGTAEHMVVWNRGRVARELPTLGGAYWNTPMDINDLGDVVGFSDLPGDGPQFGQQNFQAFFWSWHPYLCNGARVPGGRTCDLGALGGASGLSEALGVNNRDQVVGVSLDTGHAFIWQNGRMTDLNSLVAPGTTLTLTNAEDINDQGVITGQATLAANPKVTVAFEAIPVN